MNGNGYLLMALIACMAFLSQACKRKEVANQSISQTKAAKSFFCAPFKGKAMHIGRDYFLNKRHELIINSDGDLWNSGDTLGIYFLDGPQEICDSVIKVASEWSLYANIYFKQTTSIEKSAVRITFLRGGWRSLVGKQANCNHVTMFLENLDIGYFSGVEFRRVVLHEFGHAIGLEHEQLHPMANIQWDTAAVYRYYCDTLKWPKSDVDMFVLTPLNVPSSNYTDYDSSSIMHYNIPVWMTSNGFSVNFKDDLSDNDKAAITSFYPFSKNSK